VLLCIRPRHHQPQAGPRPALRKSEERYHGLFEGVPVGLYRTTPAGRMLDANSALVRILGHPDLESLLEAQVGDLYLDPDDRHRWQRAFEGPGSVRSFEARVRRRLDGVVIWVRFTVRAVRGEEGEILHYEGALEDITDRRRAEEGLRASEERFRSLVQNASESDLDSRRRRHRALREPLPQPAARAGAGDARGTQPPRPRSPWETGRSSRSRSASSSTNRTRW